MSKKLKIGWSDWIEDLNPSVPSASGARNWCMNAWKELQNLGHEVYFLQPIDGTGSKWHPGNFVNIDYAGKYSYPLPQNLDAIFMAHRWQVPNHPERWGPALRQREILDLYADKIPIVMHDEDLTVTREFEEEYPELIYAEPSLSPVTITKQRFRLFFPMFNDKTVFLWKGHRNKPYTLIYVGNNYNRLYEAGKYYEAAAASGLKTLFVGNWMVQSEERPPAREVMAVLPSVSFMDRVPPKDLENINLQGSFTVHIAPQNYNERGFMTGRWAEAALYGLISFVPKEFYMGETIFGNDFVADGGPNVAGTIRVMLQNEERRPGFMHSVASIQRSRIMELGLFDARSWVRQLGKAWQINVGDK